MKIAHIGFLGCGNIGGGVWTLLHNMRADIARCYQLKLDVKRMLVRDINEPRRALVDTDRLTTDVDDILNDPKIDIVCEFMGGEQPAAQYMLRALESGKSVVTANKMALSLHWGELHEAARRGGARLYFEAAVCGAIPVIRAIQESMTGNRVDAVQGILNGTTNFILTRMAGEGLAYAQALKQAQALGLAEPNPESDVSGWDAAYKLSILSSLCFGCYIHPADIARTGIVSVTMEDVRAGAEMGYELKLIARAKKDGNAISACVSPAFVPLDSQLARVSGAFNGVTLHGHASDDIFLYGRGAGSEPTAGAVVADILQAARPTRFMRTEAYPRVPTAPEDGLCYVVYAANINADTLRALVESVLAPCQSVRALPFNAGAAALTAPAANGEISRVLQKIQGARAIEVIGA